MLVYLHNYESAPNNQWTKIAKLPSFKEITKIFNDKHLRYKMRFPCDHRNNVCPHLCARLSCSHADINFVKAQHFHAFAYQSYQRFFLSIIFKFLYIIRPVCTGERMYHIFLYGQRCHCESQRYTEGRIARSWTPPLKHNMFQCWETWNIS